jgi:hypothetical protein
MEKTIKELLVEASVHLGKAKVSAYNAEQIASNSLKPELIDVWWSLDYWHKRVSKLI